jgi:hypothetical protein
MPTPLTPERDPRAVGCLVLGLAAVIAVASARAAPGSWNDSSRLATVESLVDYHTLAIDRTVFRTGDKLFIRDHFYSDKSPVPAVLMAGAYQGLQWTTGLTAREHPRAFCYALTLAFAGLPYAVAVWCLYRLGRPLGLALPLRLGLTASFALATVALPYARCVNGHVLLLGVAAPLVLGLARLAEDAAAGRLSWSRLLGLGTLAGLGYTVDLGAGPVLLACTLGLVGWRCRRLGPVAAFLAAAVPWLALHHAVNYAVGGTLAPANTVAAYFQWPGCAFAPRNLTGGWHHADVGHFLTYAAALLVGKQGFLGHNLPLWLAVPGCVALLRRRTAAWPEVVFACCWCGGTWLLYAASSTNYSGRCCSVRWFVPLLAPAYYVLALLLRDRPRWRGDFVLLSASGGVLGLLMWWRGPWLKFPPVVYWPLLAVALFVWLVYRIRLWRRATHDAGPAGPKLPQWLRPMPHDRGRPVAPGIAGPHRESRHSWQRVMEERGC